MRAAQVAAVLQPRIGAERAEERLLKGVLAPVAEQPAQVGEDRVLVLLVERLEGRDAHRLHLPLKRTSVSSREMWCKRVAKWGEVV